MRMRTGEASREKSEMCEEVARRKKEPNREGFRGILRPGGAGPRDDSGRCPSGNSWRRLWRGLWRDHAPFGAWRGWRLELARGARIPRGYALAWVDMSRWVAVCYPWPVNLAARCWRTASWRLRQAVRAFHGPGRDAQLTAAAQRTFRQRQALAERYAAGYLCGWQDCFDACMEVVEEELGPLRRRRHAAGGADASSRRGADCEASGSGQDGDCDGAANPHRSKPN
jgi:hypothetical protein